MAGGPTSWTVVGMLQGIKAAFGFGGKHIIPAGGTQGTSVIPSRELEYAQKTIAAGGMGYWTRMEKSEAKLKVWHQDFADLVEKKLKANFHPQNYARMCLMVHSSSNPLVRVVRDLSTLYETPPHRYLELPEEPKALPEGEPPEGLEPETEETAPEPTEDEDAATKPPAPPEEMMGSKPMATSGDAMVEELADVLELEGHADGEEEEGPFEKWERISKIDTIMETVEFLTRFLPAVWVRPYVRYEQKTQKAKSEDGTEYEEEVNDESTGKLEYIIYTPDMADVVCDPENPCMMMAWWYWSKELNEKSELVRRVNFFSKRHYVKLDEQWRILKVEPIENGIPVVEFRIGHPIGGYFCDGTGDDLFEGTIELCVLRTIQNARARDAGFKQLVLNADPEKVPADQVMGGPTPIYTGDDGTAEVLDLQPYLDQWTDLCEKRSLELAAKYGITAAEYKAEGAPQSGYAKKIDRDKIEKENRRARKYFIEGERALYKKTALELKTNPVPEIGVLDSEHDMHIDFAEPFYDEAPKDQAQTDAQNLKLNKTSIVDILKRDNPDLSEAELVKLAYRNQRINDAFITKPAQSLLDILAAPTTPGGGKAQMPGQGGGPGGPPPPGGKKPPFGGEE